MKNTHLDFYGEQIEKANNALRGGRSKQATQCLFVSIAESLAAIADHLEKEDDERTRRSLRRIKAMRDQLEENDDAND